MENLENNGEKLKNEINKIQDSNEMDNKENNIEEKPKLPISKNQLKKLTKKII